ncbi:aminotransferase class I/II-fold pyridoxal phosphate-dependent enzyme [Aspergillus brunneoviolaceus CBS 621.78]|uniref:PLP-dependent transferase n=1 Tax=Aspergillus brunneoviolaceus CBS 621.78 TaxID=1450534 RepID=A0ACD1FYW4_9EURO|nr:PLP-dependent transferase [Aspergillus brunneoviolaceus CBS 621.78]RAH42174.1 PLP-dependent transferase [Aspergillus brunneoviolaceus CBS 621.78]
MPPSTSPSSSPLPSPSPSHTPTPQPSLRQTLRQTLHQRARNNTLRKLTLPAPNATDFSSNDFLSLSTNPLYRRRYLHHLTTLPPSHPLASGGSRLLDGNSASTEALESQLARFHNSDSALLFNSGFDANWGVLSTLPQPNDLILYDEAIHASAHEGMRRSRASQALAFRHSSPQSLHAVLSAQIQLDPTLRDGSRNVFVVVESVYSMDGDVAPLTEFVAVVDALLPRGNGYWVVDEAHATGVCGPKGAGVVQGLGLEGRMYVRVHTFGKALGCHGAVVLCDPDTREYLINYARSLIYTTALGFPFLAAIRTAYEMLEGGETVELQETLHQRIRYLRERLTAIQPVDATLFTLDHHPGSPIFSLRCALPRRLAAACQARGYVVRAILPPTVPAGQERVRVCLHAGNTEDEIDGLVETIVEWLEEAQGEEQMQVAKVARL